MRGTTTGASAGDREAGDRDDGDPEDEGAAATRSWVAVPDATPGEAKPGDATPGDATPGGGPVAFRTAPLRSRRAGPAIVAGVLAIAFVGVAIAKPWGIPAASKAPVAVPALQARPSAVPVGPASTRAAALVAPERTSPGFGVATGLPPSAATLAELVRQLVARSGTWGVGVGGTGPRILRDDLWTEWVAITPVTTGPNGSNLGVWPGTGICTETPVLNDRPILIAVTAPAGLAPDWGLVGWWTDGGHVARLAGLVRQISPPGNRQISYLERYDRSPWPDGRYEFHVVTGTHELGFTICLGRS